MKNIRNHVISLGASCVLALGVALAQDQAAAPQPAAQPPPAAAARQPGETAAVPLPHTSPFARKGVTAGSARAFPAAKAASPAVPAASSPAQPASSDMESPAGQPEGAAKSKTTTPALKFDNAPSDIILQAYAQETGKTLLFAPDTPKANITLKSQPDVKLSKEEYVEAIEVVLSMNGIVLEPFGEKFVKVLARKTVRTDGIKILMESPEHGHPEKTKVVSQMIQLKAITVAEAQKALEGFKKPDGLFQTFERTNSILVTDTQENVNRMLEIVKFIDQPLVTMEEVNVRIIRFAKAEDIKKRLEELVAESQKQAQAKEEIKANTSGAPGFSRTAGSSLSLSRPMPPGLTRLGAQPQVPAAATPNENLQTLISDADRGMIRGKVQIIADERSNKLIIITRPENMMFFDKVIEVLDIETAPDIQVKIIRLQHATVEGKDGDKGIAEILNELIGNASASKNSAQKGSGTSKSKSSSSGDQGGNQNLTEKTPVSAPAPMLASMASTGGGVSKNKVGELSKENITILADPRINGLVVMASPIDMAVIESIIEELDIELEQVLIETVLLQVTLSDKINTGVDWVQKTIRAKNAIKYVGAGGAGASDPVGLVDSLPNTVIGKTPGIRYFLTLDKLGVDAVVSASKEDSLAKVLSSPVLMTVNNREAVMESTEMRYLYKGLRYSGSQYSGSEVPDYEQRDFGLTIKVTPRISPNGNVMMTVDEKFENLGTEQFIPGAGTTSMTNGGGGGAGGYFPTINTRKLQADVSVSNGTTVVLGGLVTTTVNESDSGTPILKDIPLIGKYLFGQTEKKEERTELLVFLTPYVLSGSEAGPAEARRRKNALSATRTWQDGGWSKSALADPPSSKEVLRKQEQEWALEDEVYATDKKLDKARQSRNEKLLERAKKDQKGGTVTTPVEETKERAPNIIVKELSETTEVIKPSESVRPAAVEPPPRPEAEPPKKAWWRPW